MERHLKVTETIAQSLLLISVTIAQSLLIDKYYLYSNTNAIRILVRTKSKVKLRMQVIT